ncbi:hypothetical protein HPB50_027010 [Hyalomma asiaticum]|uniref:Uncharacterized protein n=1 Tax=Hyalomma asiaticum TaxID=266040 RepID=A0ACB7SLP0_HYAAI|nr:hypothetical protein HPB50_027010 [Hyalomma asiaticum]
MEEIRRNAIRLAGSLARIRVSIGARPWSASDKPAMSGQLVNWMHRVLPFSKNTRSPQHCNAAYDHASSNASSRNASPLHCASSRELTQPPKTSEMAHPLSQGTA